MNRRNVKRVKDPPEDWNEQKRLTPILAGEKVCEKAMPRQEPLEVKPLNSFQESVGPLLTRAHNYMQDIQNLNSELSSDSALLLLSAALTDIKAVAGILGIKLEG